MREQEPKNFLVILLNVLCTFEFQLFEMEMQNQEKIPLTGSFCYDEQ